MMRTICLCEFFFFFFFFFFFKRARVLASTQIYLLETKAELVLSSPLDVTKDPVYALFDLTHTLDTKNHRSD